MEEAEEITAREALLESNSSSKDDIVEWLFGGENLFLFAFYLAKSPFYRTKEIRNTTAVSIMTGV